MRNCSATRPTIASSQVSIEFNSKCTEDSCHAYAFDDSVMTTTLVTDFDLVCDRLSLVPVITSSYMAGVSILEWAG